MKVTLNRSYKIDHVRLPPTARGAYRKIIISKKTLKTNHLKLHYNVISHVGCDYRVPAISESTNVGDCTLIKQ